MSTRSDPLSEPARAGRRLPGPEDQPYSEAEIEDLRAVVSWPAPSLAF